MGGEKHGGINARLLHQLARDVELAEVKAELTALKQRGACLDEQMDAGILVDLGKHNGDRTGMGDHNEAD